MDYIEAQGYGFKYVTRDPVGGESVHKTEPKLNSLGCWISPGWRFVQDVASCPKGEVMPIEEAIQIHSQKMASGEIEQVVHKAHAPYIKTKRCVICKKDFESVNNAKYCSEECRIKAKEAKYKRSQAKRRLIGFNCTCQNCKKQFRAQSQHKKYCSDECRREYWRKGAEQ